MPMYRWKCVKCKREADVVRQFSEYEREPKEDEDIEPSECSHSWERQVGGQQTLQRGPSWQGRKGHW